MQENWIRWEPLPNLNWKYDVENLWDDQNGFKLELYSYRERKEHLLLTFANSVVAYEYVDESYQIGRLHRLAAQYGDDFFCWTFFKIINSTATEKFELSHGCGSAEELKHFCLILGNAFFVIIATQEPNIEVVESGNR